MELAGLTWEQVHKVLEAEIGTMLAPSTEPIRTIYTSHSIDNTFESCARKFEFLNVFDRRPPRDSGYAAEIGTALHEGWQAYLVGLAEGKGKDESEVDAFLALMLHFPWSLEPQQKQSTRSFENTASMLKEMIRRPEWDHWELIKIDGKWAVEVPFTIFHTSIGVFRIQATGELCQLATQGKIDAILRHKITGRIACWDAKTTVMDENLIRSEYTWSGQQVGYGQVLQALLGESLLEFDVYYLVCRFAANDPAHVQVVPFDKAEENIDDYWFDKIDRLKRMRYYAETGRFPRRNGGCNSYQHECSCFTICPSRDTELIIAWFQSIGAVEQKGYEAWVTLEL